MQYKKWKHLIPFIDDPMLLRNYFFEVFKCYPEECKTICYNPPNMIISTERSISINGAFGDVTDEPFMIDETGYFYNGGCTWGIDDFGNRFFKLDKKTNLPAYWNVTFAISVLKKYIDAVQNDEIFNTQGEVKFLIAANKEHADLKTGNPE